MLDHEHVIVSAAPLHYHEAQSRAFYREDWPTALQTVHLIHSVVGFRLAALPMVEESAGLATGPLMVSVLKRFAHFIRSVHSLGQRTALALSVVARPGRTLIGSKVEIYLLCRAASEQAPDSVRLVQRFAEQVTRLLPRDGVFSYGMLTALPAQELREVLFHTQPDEPIALVEVRKFEDRPPPNEPNAYLPAGDGLDYFPHCFWPDQHFNPWLSIIELLAQQTAQTAVTIILEPTALIEVDAIDRLAQLYRVLANEGERRQDLLDAAAQVATEQAEELSWLQKMQVTRFYKANRLQDHAIVRAKRGMHTYKSLLAEIDQLFMARVVVASSEVISNALVQLVRTALFAPLEDSGGTGGWRRPVAVRPQTSAEKAQALQCQRWLGQIAWGESRGHPKLQRVRSLVHPHEATSLFHLPLISSATQTSVLSIAANVPFVVPQEVMLTDRFKPDTPLINLGYLYQRSLNLNPATVGMAQALPFSLSIHDLEKPSVLVGAPGSGKSTMAVHILQQLWRDHQVPFLVLDPSTGQEYRYLYADPDLRDDLVLYTLGDDEVLPFRFNPFQVPPDITVRSHITRLLACFKAAYEFWDPLPAIYEAALARLYASEPFGWALHEKGGVGKPCPTLADFAQAIVIELDDHVLPDYGPGSEAAGVLTGASKIRVNSVLNSLGHIINASETDTSFFERLLTRPIVIEMGSLGDSSSIALVMAFLVIQLVGHIEHVAKKGLRKQRPHLLLIEEAHRLLSAESVGGGPNQGNTRSKSADELNTLLAEVRKFRQGIMILDQRPSSLVGGVLDNALVTMLCRLNDRVGFEHLSNTLNLSPAQQRYARTRLKPGDVVVLDTVSGQPVLVRAPNVLDPLREARLAHEPLVELVRANAARARLVAPPAAAIQPPPTVRSSAPARPDLSLSLGDELLQAVTDLLISKVDADPGGPLNLLAHLGADLAESAFEDAKGHIRRWLMVGATRKTVNPILERIVLAQALAQLPQFAAQTEDILTAFSQLNTQNP